MALFGPKKLKPIPRDVVPYIAIETEAIRDINDKMLISSYCCNKLEMVEWQLQVLEMGSKQYIVTQSKAQLEVIRDQLVECHKRIMAVKIDDRKTHTTVQVSYPKGYEG